MTMRTKPPAEGVKKTVKNINIAVDVDVHQLLRMQAAREGITLKEYIVRSALAAVSPELFTLTATQKKRGAK
jgi:predicted HicB family RNase H-like nuclease